MMARRFTPLGLALGLALIPGCNREIAGGSVDGARIYRDACALCHGEHGVPPLALTAQLGVRDLTSPEFRTRVTKDLVVGQVTRGSENKKMPAFTGTLTPEQIESVAAYVAHELK